MRRCISFGVFFINMVVSFAIPYSRADDHVGTVAALRGSANIERDAEKESARLNSQVSLRDAVSTVAASRIKLHFIDDSILTLGEKSRVVVREFLNSRGVSGRSIFNLLEGRMRSVVGKQRFEVHTPTAVAAARGTVFIHEAGVLDGKQYTRIICLEGVVEVHGTVGEGSASMSPGMVINIIGGQPFPTPTAVTPALLKELMEATSLPGPEGNLSGGKSSLNVMTDKNSKVGVGSVGNGTSIINGVINNQSVSIDSSNAAIGHDNKANMGSIGIENSQTNGGIVNQSHNTGAANISIGNQNESNMGAVGIK